MPTFHYYATFDESLVILQDICAQGYHVVAYPGFFDQPQVPIYATVSEELEALLKTAPAFFLTGNFTRFPVQFHTMETSPSAKYSINFLAEGPVMQAMVARDNVVDGTPTLLPGNVSHQNKYRNPETDEWAKASKEVKAAFRQLAGIIKQHCVLHKAAIDIYIAPAALELLESGNAEILYPYAV